MSKSLKSIAKMIDHSLLHPSLTDEQLLDGFRFAVEKDVAAVSTKPYAVPMAKEVLDGSDVAVGSVVGFPHGNSRIEIKVREAELACEDGAVELDAVLNIGKVLSRDWDYMDKEIGALNKVARKNGALLKLIFENDYLDDDSFKVELCRICSSHSVAFVKTSTGYGFVKQKGGGGMYSYQGATDHDLRLMRARCVPGVQVKAAGGVRTLDDLLRVMELGVTRVGATATGAILKEAVKRGYK
ncbi:MAG: deoxyribose-phosphate aldolase [Gemmatimonadota bacterium]|nr:deoxyribose-phosphate aldolase [Gemmatimonadota bacterium]